MRTARLLAIFILAAGMAAAPAHGGSDDTGERPLSEELDEALRSLMEHMKPALDELQETLKVFDEIDSIENYQRPEVLPNGDIIIRRREDAPPLPRDDEDKPADERGVKT